MSDTRTKPGDPKANKGPSDSVKPGNSKKVTPQMLLDAIDRTANSSGIFMRRIAIFTAVLAGLAVIFAGYQMTRPPIPPKVYAAERETGRVTELRPYERIPTNPGSIANTTQRFTTILFSMNAFNYVEHFDSTIRPAFVSEDYYLEHVANVRASAWFKEMINNEMQMRANIAGAPVILDEGLINAGQTNYWDVNVPIYIRLEASGLQPVNVRRIMTIRIVHSGNREHRDGLAIQQVQLERE